MNSLAPPAWEFCHSVNPSGKNPLIPTAGIEASLTLCVAATYVFTWKRMSRIEQPFLLNMFLRTMEALKKLRNQMLALLWSNFTLLCTLCILACDNHGKFALHLG